MTEHPPIDSLARFARGLLPPREMATVAIHVARCETCRTAATRPSIHPGTGPSTYGEAIHRVARRAGHRATQHELAKKRAPGALDQILALPTEEWNRAIRSSPKYHSYAFAQYALRACKRDWTDEPRRGLRLAELALEVANRLPNSEHGRRNLNDLRSTAWAYIANSRRVLAHYAAVPENLAAAGEHLRTGNGLEVDRAAILGFTSSFLADTYRFTTAMALLDELDHMYRNLRDRHLQGKNLLKRGHFYYLQKNYTESATAYRRAAELLEAKREPHLEIAQKRGVAFSEAEVGDPALGLQLLQEAVAEPLHGIGSLDRSRFVWQEGRLNWRLGKPEPAIDALTRCRRTFLQQEIDIDIALVDLDLARILIDFGHPTDALPLTREALPILAFHGFAREVIRSLELFRRAGGLE